MQARLILASSLAALTALTANLPASAERVLIKQATIEDEGITLSGKIYLDTNRIQLEPPYIYWESEYLTHRENEELWMHFIAFYSANCDYPAYIWVRKYQIYVWNGVRNEGEVKASAEGERGKPVVPDSTEAEVIEMLCNA